MRFAAAVMEPPSNLMAWDFSMSGSIEPQYRALRNFCSMDVAHHRLMPSYSDRLKRAMDERGLDIPTLAAKIGVSYQAVRKATKGGGMSAENNAKAAKVLGVNSDWLALGVWPQAAAGRQRHHSGRGRAATARAGESAEPRRAPGGRGTRSGLPGG